MPQKIIGIALTIFGLASLSLMLFTLYTQPLIQGDPNGTLFRVLVCGAVGFFSVMGGYSVVVDTSKKFGSSETDNTGSNAQP